MKTRISTLWSLKLLVAAILTAGFGCVVQAGPAAATSQSEPSPAPSPPAPAPRPEIRPTENSLPAPARAPATPLSYWAAQITKLAQAGIDDNIILSFLDNVGTVNLGADQIIYLTDQGVSRDVIAAMLQHDFEISNGWRPIPTVATPIAQTVIDVPAGMNVSRTAGSDSTVAASVQSNETPASSQPADRNPESEKNCPRNSKTGSEVIFVEFPVWEYAATEFDLPDNFFPSDQPSEPAKHTYAIREPYPVPITAPIIVIEAATIQPNIVRVESFH